MREDFSERGQDKTLKDFLEKSTVALEMVKNQRFTATLLESVSDFERPYLLGLQKPTALSLFQFPHCPATDCRHSHLVQQESTASISATNAGIKAENVRRAKQFEYDQTGSSGAKIKKAPQEKPLVTPTAQCGCYPINCFGSPETNKSCTACTARFESGNPFPMILDPVSLRGMVCSCPVCLCVCRLAFATKDYHTIDRLSQPAPSSTLTTPRPSPPSTSSQVRPLFLAGGDLNQFWLNPSTQMMPGGKFRPSATTSSYSSSASSAMSTPQYAPPDAHRSGGDKLFFGNSTFRLADLPPDALDAMAASFSADPDASNSESFRASGGARLGVPSAIIDMGDDHATNSQGNSSSSAASRVNVQNVYAKTGRRHNNNGLVGSATDYNANFSYHPSKSNQTPKLNPHAPAAARHAVPVPVAPPHVTPLTTEARALREKIITHFAQKFLDDDAALAPDPLVGSSLDDPLAANLVAILNSLSTIKNVDTETVIKKLRK